MYRIYLSKHLEAPLFLSPGDTTYQAKMLELKHRGIHLPPPVFEGALSDCIREWNKLKGCINQQINSQVELN